MTAVEPRRTVNPVLAAVLVVTGFVHTENAPAADSHPIVAGFERSVAEPKLGGRVLLGELGCTACHQTNPTSATWVNRKQAPVLDQVGSRVRPSYLRDFLADPHATKPGTTMPDLLATLPADERRGAAESLAAFLGVTGQVGSKSPRPKQLAAGRTLYRQVGCVACHGPLDPASPRAEGSVPLGNLAAKYELPGLAAFLLDPHQARPSGRMPGLRLTREEAASLASALLADQIRELQPNLAYLYYEGTWSKLPDFATLQPVATGECLDFDISKARRPGYFAFQFRGEVRIDREGDYTFHLRGDDGCRLSLDDSTVVDNDGIHPPVEKSGSVHLKTGPHRLVVDFFQGEGEAELDVSYEGPGLPRQDFSPTPIGVPKPTVAPSEPDPKLVNRGRDLFASIGCASCHQLKEGDQAIEPTGTYPSLADLHPNQGCLAASPEGKAPRFGLDERQRIALASAITDLDRPDLAPPTNPEQVVLKMTALNCYACHERGGVGGATPETSAAFETTEPEMGDEGRIPPRLDGVGAKLQAQYLAQIFAEGAKDRPYMLTRMPRFGGEVTGPLAKVLESPDQPAIPDAAPLEFSEDARKVKAAGRFLVGGQGLNCIACHTFKDVQAQGIQAIDMTTMTHRLRREWFDRYLPDPASLRPGTRMPSGWPDGQSMQPTVLGGSAPHQVEAIWNYLADGRDAALPFGLGRDAMPLVPTDEPILYRNFIEGAGSRAIGVGYPEHANLAFDANTSRLALIWQGAFIDASRHWVDRGVGFQPPLGDNVVALPSGPAFATLSGPAAPWPSEPAARFRGYRLDPAGRPTFLYEVGPVQVEDTPTPIAAGPHGSPTFRRTLDLRTTATGEPLTYRAGVADKIEPLADGWFTLGNGLKMRLRSDEGSEAVRKVGDKAELMIPVQFREGRVRIVQEIDW